MFTLYEVLSCLFNHRNHVISRALWKSAHYKKKNIFSTDESVRNDLKSVGNETISTDFDRKFLNWKWLSQKWCKSVNVGPSCWHGLPHDTDPHVKSDATSANMCHGTILIRCDVRWHVYHCWHVTQAHFVPMFRRKWAQAHILPKLVGIKTDVMLNVICYRSFPTLLVENSYSGMTWYPQYEVGWRR